MKENILMFDVESTSLHGYGFAVGAIVANRTTGLVLDQFHLVATDGAEEANEWVKQNVIPEIEDVDNVGSINELRTKFYEFYLKWRPTSDTWSDCCFPVETNFLSAILADAPIRREWEMPYPLFDMATIISIDIDRLDLCGVSGLMKHRPLDDAIASLDALLRHTHNTHLIFPE